MIKLIFGCVIIVGLLSQSYSYPNFGINAGVGGSEGGSAGIDNGVHGGIGGGGSSVGIGSGVHGNGGHVGVVSPVHRARRDSDDCPTVCPYNYAPVCVENPGGEPRLFGNQCALNSAECTEKKQFTVVPCPAEN